MMNWFNRQSLFLGWCGFLWTAPALAQAPDQKPDAQETRLRSLLNAKLNFSSYVFNDVAFPQVSFEQPAQVEELLGPFTIQVTYYDRNYQRMETAQTPGLYGAMVEIVPKTGRAMRRYSTLFRTTVKVDSSWRFDPEKPDELAKRVGIEPAVIKHQASLIGEQLKQRPFDECVRDAQVARLLAGLALSKAGNDSVRTTSDAFAAERQWWVGLKRRRTGMDQVYSHAVVCPQPIEGKAAPVLREGTAAEAGMKTDAAEKIDAICQTWADDDDQAFAVCIARHGVIVLHKAYGQRDGKPMTITTKSWMASVTKSMSATLMMTLVDRGLVRLDDPVDKYLPALRGIKVAQPLTIRHLYTHTNGLAKWPGWHDDLPDVEERIADYYPRLQIGKEFGYNGTGYILGGKIIETISGESVPQYYQRHLLGPLGCDHTDVRGTHADAMSVPLDVARFGQMLLNRGAYGPMRFFREDTFQQMLPQDLSKVIGLEVKRSFGIGLDGTPDRFGHGAASAATFSVDRTEDLVVIMTRNKMGKNQGKYNGKFWDAIRDGIDKTAANKPK